MDTESEREFCSFVSARSQALFRSAYLLTGQAQAAEDLVQTALTKLAARWSRVDQPEAYVRRVMYHYQVSRWRLRSWGRETTVEELPDRAANRADDPDLRLSLLHALARLSRGQRAVVVLRYFEDMPEANVAQILGISTGTVRSQCSRALARLRVLCPDLANEGVQR
jgi:RNA polymerase sigma-70 factor (sigma-E family)